MRKKIGILIVIVMVITSCGGTKGIGGAKLKKMKAEKVIDKYNTNTFDFNTLNAKLRVRYEGKKQSVSPSVTLRMKKDEKIWLSAKMLGITLAKVLITPDKVSYYEKINNSYFEGDFSVLSKFLGTTLNFEQIQQMLIGKAIFDLNSEAFQSSVVSDVYILKPKEELALFQRLLAFNPNTFKLQWQQIAQAEKNRSARINYEEYQKVANQDFPKKIEIQAKDESDITKIKIEYKTVDYNAAVSFPFSIPKGYEKVSIE
ncbi:DUF4292 domain-containing protein [Aquimarina sp. ERC-38]|uniref:DUF4292 domain-containing protein n=1 Tax=Aquimarina sp. ERC-38 TaxID=2949996 RepID=UPI002246C45A|nr:DUF4292 domain-containing protein [Aquimarina sp. ERC-38]UZO81659.1 DUF4292 domain-containing protein [Aquimarina sp. ERC-38]